MMLSNIDDKKKDIAAALLLVAAVAVVYHNVYGFDFVSYDDDIYITNNEHVHGGITTESLTWAFFSSYFAMWQPLIWLSHMLDVSLYGMKAGPPHVENAALHAANSVLMYLALSAATGSRARSVFAAALFAVHPQHVESVAWVTERKDVLSAFFWWSSILAYVRYTKNPSVSGYAAVFALYAAGLCSKSMLVTLPFVLLLLDGWPLGRWGADETSSGIVNSAGSAGSRAGRLVIEKIPLFALTAAVSVITMIAQSAAHAVKSLDQFPITIRISNAAASYAMYLSKALWPSGLGVMYPYHEIAWWRVAAAACVLAGITFMALANARKRGYLATGWLWYLGTLVPVIGLVQVGGQSRADRYTYIPMAGIYIIAAWGIPEALSSVRRRREILTAAGAVVAAVLMICAINQTGYWRNSKTLIERALAVSSDNPVAEVNMGLELALSGKVEESLPHFAKAVRIAPTMQSARYNYGATLFEFGKYAEAATQLVETIKLDPSNAYVHLRYGATLAALGRTEEAIVELLEARRLDPANEDIPVNIGLVYARAGKFEDAAREFQRAVTINPASSTALYNLGLAHVSGGRTKAAVRWFIKAVRVKPDYAQAYFNLGSALQSLNDNAGAVGAFAEAVRLEPSDYAAHLNFGIALAATGDFKGARTQLEETLRLNPDSTEAKGYLAELDRNIAGGQKQDAK
jgi:tetratricopeptide (TPR) repeat protein